MAGFKLIVSGALSLAADKIGQSSPYYTFLLVELQHVDVCIICMRV